jgi:lysophospholipase L1-like esterase
MKISISKRIGFSVLVSLFLLGGTECGLRLAGYHGDVDRRVSWCREQSKNEPPFFIPQQSGSTLAYAPRFEGQPRPFPVHKASNTRRIFVFGGSAVHGYGFTRPGAWPDQLEERLALAWPGVRVEVINAGAIAWSSQQLLIFIKDVLANYEPDAIVIASGNNELLEWFDARKYLPEESLGRWVKQIRWGVRLRRFRLYRLLTARFGGQAGHWGQTEFSDDEALDWSERARMKDADRDFAVERYRANLNRILEEAGRANVPVVLGTVPVNWMEMPGEFAFADAFGDTERARVAAAERSLQEGELEAADRQIENLMAEWPEASFAYRYGRKARELGLSERARKWLAEAIRLDENPHRALPAVNQVVRDLAGKADGFVDIQGILEAGQPDGILDSKVVYDYCHLRPGSHGLVADAVADLLVTDLWPEGNPVAAPVPLSVHFDGWLGEGVDGDRGGYSPNPGRDRKRWWAAAKESVEERPEDVASWLGLGRVNWHIFHGQCGPQRAPCLPEVATALDQAIRVDSKCCEAWANRGLVAYASGEDKAVELLEHALECEPADARTAWYLKRIRLESQ